MAWIPAAVHAAIKNKDLNKVLFQDPLGDETRKAKRNLLIAAFTCLLIAVLKLHVTSFLGLSAGTDGLGNELAQGLSVLVVIYMLVGYCFHVFVDYSAWKFERERLQTQPYFDFISLYESSYRAMTEQIANAVGEIPTLKRKPQNFNEQGIERAASECLMKLENIDKHIQELHGEGSPLIAVGRRLSRAWIVSLGACGPDSSFCGCLTSCCRLRCQAMRSTRRFPPSRLSMRRSSGRRLGQCVLRWT